VAKSLRMKSRHCACAGESVSVWRQEVDVRIAAARGWRHRLRATLDELVDGLQLGEAPVGL
jgi:hypothetical protein